MLKLHNEYRAKFPREGMQQKWLETLRETISISDIASICTCSERTVRDWQREKFLMDCSCVDNICKTYNINSPTIQKIPRFAHTRDAGRKGGLQTIKKYGKIPIKESVRKARWRKWWEHTGKHARASFTQAKRIYKPCKDTKLAEFIGIMLGDGTISNYHIAITLHLRDDKDFSTHIIQLIEELFHVEPKVYVRKKHQTLVITVARKMLVDYLHSLGLPIGNKIKQGLSIPQWVMKNEDLMRACMRGLMDTDGSVFEHRYFSKHKQYTYKKISFSSASLPLRDDVSRILTHFHIQACSSGTNVRIDSKVAVDRYMKLIGSHNPKHLIRISK